MDMTNRSGKFLPVVFALLLAAGVFLGSRISAPLNGDGMMIMQGQSKFNKISDVIDYIQNEYVDTVNRESLVDASIEKMLQELDPHSAYIPASELQAANEPLEGNFEGVGIEFHIQSDTIMVVSAISGGPSEHSGIRAGDRIVKVNDTLVAGTGITNNEVMHKLRGPGGTKVKVLIYRRDHKGLLTFNITRGKIPLYSVDAAFMADPVTGYIKISRFAATTYEEFMEAATRLERDGMKQMIIDLRGNPGGYLDAATKMADEFLADGKLMVYTQGKARPRSNYKATGGGKYEKMRVAILIDEGSASASEILAGALQDWDRATILGRRSFGKGLVQEQTILPDGSALRLTIARYYTPTGRSIQKPYENGIEQYHEELFDRYDHNEMLTADSISFPDSLKFTTPGGKTVYGGGGIMPDVFVPIDTTDRNSMFLISVLNMGLVSQFAYDYVDNNRPSLSKYSDFSSYDKGFRVSDEMYTAFTRYAVSKGVTSDNAEEKAAAPYLKSQLRAYIGRQLFRNEGFYPILLREDPGYRKAVEIMTETGS